MGRVMSDTSQGDGWWQASDGMWYPPERRSMAELPPPPPRTPSEIATDELKRKDSSRAGRRIILFASAIVALVIAGALAVEVKVDGVFEASTYNCGTVFSPDTQGSDLCEDALSNRLRKLGVVGGLGLLAVALAVALHKNSRQESKGSAKWGVMDTALAGLMIAVAFVSLEPLTFAASGTDSKQRPAAGQALSFGQANYFDDWEDFDARVIIGTREADDYEWLADNWCRTNGDTFDDPEALQPLFGVVSEKDWWLRIRIICGEERAEAVMRRHATGSELDRWAAEFEEELDDVFGP